MSEEDLVSRAAEERERIFERYEYGRERLLATAQIDSWEDPDHDAYHRTDSREAAAALQGPEGEDRAPSEPASERAHRARSDASDTSSASGDDGARLCTRL